MGLDVTDNRLSEAAVLRLGPNWLRRLVVGGGSCLSATEFRKLAVPCLRSPMALRVFALPANCITSFPAFLQADWPVLLELDLSRWGPVLCCLGWSLRGL